MTFKPGKTIKELELGGKKVVFRYLKPSDAEQALEHINSLIRERAKITWQKPFTLKGEREWISSTLKKIRDGFGVCILVEIDRKCIGSGEVRIAPGHAGRHVGLIGISLEKGCRGMGIGREFMKLLLQQARDVLKCSIAILEVYSNNAGAIRLYEKAGFREFGRLPKGANHYGEYHDVIFMHKELGK